MVDPPGIPLVRQRPKRRPLFGLGTLLTLPIYIAVFCVTGVGLGWTTAVLTLSVPVPIVILCRHYDISVWNTVFFLVVVSMLAALVVPAMPSRTRFSRRAGCMDNLNSIGRATVLFADGHIETLREQMSREKLLDLLTFEKKDPAERCSNGEDALRDARNSSHHAPP